jgi:hypothetical protein
VKGIEKKSTKMLRVNSRAFVVDIMGIFDYLGLGLPDISERMNVWYLS